MEATSSIEPAPGALAPGLDERPKPSSRLRVPASDERLVKRIRGGDDAAFTTLYERYQPRLLSFCRHMLGSQAEAEDAVQQCFVNAYRDIVRKEKALHVRAWLYRIARNQCLSMLRARRFEPELDEDRASLRGLSQDVAERAELRELLHDLGGLPADQREALVLAELNDNSHAEVAEILGCDREKVKSLVFQARSSLIKSRDARALPCAEVQRQLSVLTGGSLRRSGLRRHLAECPACRAFQADVKSQRAALALVLPIVPSGSLKLGAAGALAAAKASAGTAATSASTAGLSGSAATTLAAKLGASSGALKAALATVAVTAAAGGAAGIEVSRHHGTEQPARQAAPAAGRLVQDPTRTPESAAPGGSGARPDQARRGGIRAGRPPAGKHPSSVPGRARGLEQRRPGAGRPAAKRGDPTRSGNRTERGRRATKPGRSRTVPLRERLGERRPDATRRPLTPERRTPALPESAADELGTQLPPG
jgi:RNA polymerase sigma factor (sigma-70 family)